MTAKERIADIKKRLETIKLRKAEHKEEEKLQMQIAKEEKKHIKEEKFRLKHPKLYRAKKIATVSAKAGGKALGYGVAQLYTTYRRGVRVRQQRKLRMK